MSKKRTAKRKPKTLLRQPKRKKKYKQLSAGHRASMARCAAGGRRRGARIVSEQAFRPGWLARLLGNRNAAASNVAPTSCIVLPRVGSFRPLGRETERGGIIKMHSYVIGHLDRWKSP